MLHKLYKFFKFVIINFSAFDTVISNMHLLVISSNRSFCTKISYQSLSFT